MNDTGSSVERPLERSLPPSIGWAAAAGALGGIAVLTVMLGPRVRTVPLDAAALLAATALVAASGALCGRLRGKALAVPADSGAHACLWALGFGVAAAVAFSVLHSGPSVPDYAMATVGPPDGRWPDQWRALATAVTAIGPILGVGSAILLRRRGVRISPGNVLLVALAWTFAWVLLSCGLLIVIGLGGGISAPAGRWSRPLEIPLVVLLTAFFGGLGGLVAGWIGEAALATVSRR